MSERRGMLLIEGELVLGTVRFDESGILAVEPEPNGDSRPEPNGDSISEPNGDSRSEPTGDLPIICPGLIDLHVHGFGGCDPLEDLAGMTRALAEVGTLAYLPTLFPDAPEALGATAARLWSQVEGTPARDSVLGLHLEGPFVNPRAAGALPADRLAEPTLEGLRTILGEDGAGVRIVTLAPELPGILDLVGELVRRGVRVSLGHSLASADEARAAAEAGASGATHLFNAMGPLHHRDVGLVGFVLSTDALLAEIIGDLVHVAPEAFALALRARGPEGLVLVSDALRGAGASEEVFESHGRRCVLRDGAVYLKGIEPPRLTGAAAPQLEAVRRIVVAGLATPAEALTMAAESPARALGIEGERGRLAVGARADLLRLSPTTLKLEEVIVGGRTSN